MERKESGEKLKFADNLFINDSTDVQKGEPSLNRLLLSGIAVQRNDKEYIQYLANLVESSDDAIISKSLEGIIKSWNKGSEKMFGYTAEQAIGRHISMIIPKGYSHDEKDIINKINNDETIAHFETVRVKKNGEQLYVSLSISPIKDQAGNIIGTSKIARDITSLKKSENELIIANNELAFQNGEKEKRAAELFVANKELVFQNGEKENRAAELIVANNELAFQNGEKEKRAAELILANIELVFQSEEKEKRAAELIVANNELAFKNEEKEKRAAELIVANKELVFENREKEKRATELIIACNELAFQNRENEKQKAELIKINGELKISGEQVKEINQELESFSYSVSHDLRAPIRAIHGYSRMLKENFETQLDPEANRLMNKIMNNAKKMGQLIDDLLNFSRIGRKELVKVSVNMDSMVANLCYEFKNEKGDQNIEFHIGELMAAEADNTTIRHVWLNLISNAIKYSGLKEKSVIKIGSEINGQEIVYYIKDNGAGFDMRYADKLFGVFQRLHSDEEFEGTGVGLALVQRIITKHGGRIWAEAVVDEGATFYFTLKTIPS
ncbi:MAG: PAS domain S-box protein [Bacteroidota bacterium]